MFFVEKLDSPERANLSTLSSDLLVSKLYDYFWPQQSIVPWYHMVWNGLSLPRVTFCVWLICHDRLPLRARLKKWGLIDSENCALCGYATEDREHLFVHCPMSKQVFQHFSPCLPFLPSNLCFTDILNLFHGSTRRTSSLFVKRAALYNSILAGIRKHRNEVIFLKTVVDVKKGS